MTFRQALQIQIKALQEIYDNAEGLRDLATGEDEKYAFNNLRRHLPNLWGPLQKLDNSLTRAGADYKCMSTYRVEVTENNI